MALHEADPNIRIPSRTISALVRAIDEEHTMELPGFLQVQTEENRIFFSLKKHPGALEIDVPSEGRYFFAPGNCFLQFSCPVEAAFGVSENVAVLDLEKASFPLYIRNARKGDRFQPLGMSGHKKLSDFFIDRKIPRGERKSIPLVFKNDDLLWVAGQQMDENFRITLKTKKFLRIELQKNV
jgi:tRNA(Ile)-lysidine synthetase-like protein